MRPYLDVLMRILLMQDTCQHHRLLSSLKGISIMVPSICQISHGLLSSVLFSIVCFHKSVPLPRVHTPLRRSTDDHPAWTVSLSEESLPLHKIFSQSMQHVSVHNCDWARQKALWLSDSPCVSIARITQWSFFFCLFTGVSWCSICFMRIPTWSNHGRQPFSGYIMKWRE